MRFRLGSTVHVDRELAVIERIDDQDGAIPRVVGYSLIGPDADPHRKYDSVAEAIQVIDLIRDQRKPG